jgi:CHAT domain-containing protein
METPDETALGKRDAGAETVSLARAILYAGSPAVVSFLWRIDDEASAEIMATFYMRLRQEKSAAEALSQAQLALLHGERFREQFFWSVHVGGRAQPAGDRRPGSDSKVGPT